MGTWNTRSALPRHRFRGLQGWLAALALLAPAMAHAQYGAPDLDSGAVGEKYHIEGAWSMWNPDLFGQISSEQFGLIGSKIDFVDDLGYKQTKFRDLKLVLRPTRKAKFRVQYTPIQYVAETALKREVVFNGQKFPVSLPLHSQFDWKVWRFGLEYDVLYKPRGFIGILVEGRYTEMTAQLASPLVTESTKSTAPLPAIGVVGRAYVLPQVALNFEVSGFKLPDIDPKYKANYFDWDINGTINLTNYVGLQVGWRRMTTLLTVKTDNGDLQFQGIWLGAVARY